MRANIECFFKVNTFTKISPCFKALEIKLTTCNNFCSVDLPLWKVKTILVFIYMYVLYSKSINSPFFQYLAHNAQLCFNLFRIWIVMSKICSNNNRLFYYFFNLYCNEFYYDFLFWIVFITNSLIHFVINFEHHGYIVFYIYQAELYQTTVQ